MASKKQTIEFRQVARTIFIELDGQSYKTTIIDAEDRKSLKVLIESYNKKNTIKALKIIRRAFGIKEEKPKTVKKPVKKTTTKTNKKSTKKEIAFKQAGRTVIVIIDGTTHKKSIADKATRDNIKASVLKYNEKNTKKELDFILKAFKSESSKIKDKIKKVVKKEKKAELKIKDDSAVKSKKATNAAEVVKSVEEHKKAEEPTYRKKYSGKEY